MINSASIQASKSSMLIFRLKEVQAKYNIASKDLAECIGVTPSLISEWRSGRKHPNLGRVNAILNAILEIGDKNRLQLYPMSLSELIEWRPVQNEKSAEQSKED
ncbi:XRE family transcriptional regulator [Leptolyngbyaceae cyanobacterium CCMR0082]|uniref:XRE family transcriptional regulator n=1 Tax=Adonisia turfae CCMR0082 TaxID=2304604 RepID=A0A6M0SF14_9CYAN|nr:helix-turn-helix transcriptional regulator [Adonisia turfae]NEZ66633.1 XRE family transcriptional regulator [Adonisia turfae CCMR0082]